jgi:hypothetical protein
VGYVFDIAAEFLGFNLLLPIAFCPSWPRTNRNLLGMEGFFEQVDFALIHSRRRALFSRATTP